MRTHAIGQPAADYLCTRLSASSNTAAEQLIHSILASQPFFGSTANYQDHTYNRSLLKSLLPPLHSYIKDVIDSALKHKSQQYSTAWCGVG